jgi:hypothetical protein
VSRERFIATIGFSSYNIKYHLTAELSASIYNRKDKRHDSIHTCLYRGDRLSGADHSGSPCRMDHREIFSHD